MEVARATPFALNEEGKISAGMAHGTGPQDAPKAIDPISALLQGNSEVRKAPTQHVKE